jgi:tRNA(fMet)-specific endonuclease VapC
LIKYLIDTDCAIFSMEGRSPALRERLGRCRKGDIAVSAITFAEITLGSKLGKPPPMNVVDAFLRAIPMAPFDEAAARAYADLPFKRARFDRLLAAHALSLDATIVTNNQSDFADVPGLRTENWTV